MQIRLLTDRVGGNGFVQHDGEIIDVAEREAFRMIERGQAEMIDAECAAVGPTENTTRTRPRFNRK